MKKIVALSFVAVASLGLAACGGAKEAAEANAATAELNATVAETVEDINAAAAETLNAADAALDNAADAMAAEANAM